REHFLSTIIEHLKYWSTATDPVIRAGGRRLEVTFSRQFQGQPKVRGEPKNAERSGAGEKALGRWSRLPPV
ncbi:hypothetical protein AVEN_242707-2-1, partial [Araneus ventricosus]